MHNLVKAFTGNRNTGVGTLRVAGPYRVKVFNGCGSHYGVETELEKGTTIVIDKIAPSENSHSTFGHINYIIRPNGTAEPWAGENRWISLASNNLVPESYNKLINKYSTNDDGTTRIIKAPNREYACEDFNW